MAVPQAPGEDPAAANVIYVIAFDDVPGAAGQRRQADAADVRDAAVGEVAGPGMPETHRRVDQPEVERRFAGVGGQFQTTEIREIPIGGQRPIDVLHVKAAEVQVPHRPRSACRPLPARSSEPAAPPTSARVMSSPSRGQ